MPGRGIMALSSHRTAMGDQDSQSRNREPPESRLPRVSRFLELVLPAEAARRLVLQT
jgi:hypothetical protein